MSAFKAKRKSTANGLKLSVVLKLLVVIFPAASAIPLQLLRKLSESNAVDFDPQQPTYNLIYTRMLYPSDLFREHEAISNTVRKQRQKISPSAFGANTLIRRNEDKKSSEIEKKSAERDRDESNEEGSDQLLRIIKSGNSILSPKLYQIQSMSDLGGTAMFRFGR